MSEPRWQVVHTDGTVCMEAIDGEHAHAAAHYFDSNAATGAPMACSPHGVRCIGAAAGTDEGVGQ